MILPLGSVECLVRTARSPARHRKTPPRVDGKIMVGKMMVRRPDGHGTSVFVFGGAGEDRRPTRPRQERPPSALPRSPRSSPARLCSPSAPPKPTAVKASTSGRWKMRSGPHQNEWPLRSCLRRLRCARGRHRPSPAKRVASVVVSSALRQPAVPLLYAPQGRGAGERVPCTFSMNPGPISCPVRDIKLVDGSWSLSARAGPRRLSMNLRWGAASGRPAAQPGTMSMTAESTRFSGGLRPATGLSQVKSSPGCTRQR